MHLMDRYERVEQAQHHDIDVYLNNFSEIYISHDAKVEDEDDVRKGDVLDLSVKVQFDSVNPRALAV